MNDYQVPVIFYFFAVIAIAALFYNLGRFFLSVRHGKSDPEHTVKLGSAVFNVLVFGIGQWRVMSKTFSYGTIMHFLLAWGFIELFFATSVDFFAARGWLVTLLPKLDTPWFAALNDLGGVMFLMGVLLALLRRHVIKPETLPQNAFNGRGNLLGDTGILLLLLLIGIGGFLAEAARLAIEQPETIRFSWIGYPLSMILVPEVWRALQPNLWWSHAVISLLFIAVLPRTKMFHALVVIINITLTDRSKRRMIRPMHVTQIMEDPEVDIDNLALGANRIKDFTRKQLLDSIACTECARCTTVCPAHNTGKPLSPMKIITAIRSGLYAEAKKNGAKQTLINGSVTETELWSCTTCGACMEECPVLIDHVPTFTEMRRHLVLSEGKPPVQANESLEKTMNSGNPWGYAQQDRIKWAADFEVEVPVMKAKKKADVLFWVGCAGSYDARNKRISQALAKIFNKSQIDFAILGNEEKCTGDSARRIGEEYLFETMALQNIDTLNQYEFDLIVTACPHCYNTIKNEYPAFSGNYRIQHHSQYIRDLLNTGRINPERIAARKITYHDACYLGRYNNEYKAPRTVIDHIVGEGGELVEMKRNKQQSFCCGAGGGNMWYDIDSGDRINLTRFQDAIDTGADTVATACSFCMIMMDDALKVKGKEDSMQLLDIAELVAQGL